MLVFGKKPPKNQFFLNPIPSSKCNWILYKLFSLNISDFSFFYLFRQKLCGNFLYYTKVWSNRILYDSNTFFDISFLNKKTKTKTNKQNAVLLLLPWFTECRTSKTVSLKNCGQMSWHKKDSQKQPPKQNVTRKFPIKI